MKELCKVEVGEEVLIFTKYDPLHPYLGKVIDYDEEDYEWVSFENESGYEIFIDAEDVFMIGRKLINIETP